MIHCKHCGDPLIGQDLADYNEAREFSPDAPRICGDCFLMIENSQGPPEEIWDSDSGL